MLKRKSLPAEISVLCWEANPFGRNARSKGRTKGITPIPWIDLESKPPCLTFQNAL
jgi:hypothetical protein